MARRRRKKAWEDGRTSEDAKGNYHLYGITSIEAELSTIVNFQVCPSWNRQQYLYYLIHAVDEANEDDWALLSEEAKKYFNDMVDLLSEGYTVLPDPREYEKEDAQHPMSYRYEGGPEKLADAYRDILMEDLNQTASEIHQKLLDRGCDPDAVSKRSIRVLHSYSRHLLIELYKNNLLREGVEIYY